jgi:SAM-dependent methyltransferase
LELDRSHVIRESSHRIHNPFTTEKLATLGAAIGLDAGQSLLDLCCGSGEMVCTWSQAHGIGGTGVDISTHFLAAARQRATELGVADRVEFVHGDAASYVARQPVDVVACIGATWIGNGVNGTVKHLRRSLKPGGLMLIGEPFWRAEPPDEEAVRGCHARSREEFDTLPGLIRRFHALDYDVVEMVLADGDSWDRYHGAQWRNIRLWLDAHPDDELAPQFRAELDRAALDHVMYVRPLLGWGVFALMPR